MHIAIRNDLDDEQSRILMAACDLAWRGIIQANVLTWLVRTPNTFQGASYELTARRLFIDC